MPPIIAAGFLGIEHFTPPWDVFFLPLFNLLVALYGILFSDFALAIIVFTVVIRTILAPLFVRQIASSKEMQRMAPLIREVRRKHKGNQRKIQEETMALYKEHNVNPAAGCLPVLLQLPILFALYQALIRASSVINFTPNDQQREPLAAWVEKANLTALGDNNYRVPVTGPCDAPPDFASLVPLNCQLLEPLHLGGAVDTTIGWLTNPITGVSLDLARPDMAFSLPIFGAFGISAIAVIAAILQFVQVKMTSPRPDPEDPSSGVTSTMLYTFPLLTIVWGGIFPSGLILYWVVYTAYLIGQQYFIMGWGNLFPLLGWRPAFAGAAPETGIVPPSRRPGVEATEPQANRSAPSRPSGGGSRGSGSANRRGGSAKRRGRRR